MNPIDFPQAQLTLAAPTGMDNCSPLRVFRNPEVALSCWQPDEAERKAIAKGAPIWLWVVAGGTQPPVALGVDNPFGDAQLQERDASTLRGLGILF